MGWGAATSTLTAICFGAMLAWTSAPLILAVVLWKEPMDEADLSLTTGTPNKRD